MVPPAVRDKTFSTHVMPQNDADVRESPGFTHVAEMIAIFVCQLTQIH